MTKTDSGVGGPTRGAERFEGVERWSARPHLARMTRLLAYGLPLVRGDDSRLAGRPTGVHPIVAGGGAVGRHERRRDAGARRRRTHRPTAATPQRVLDFSLVFPDRAPSRFAVALRAGSVSQLEPGWKPSTDGTIETDSADAAARILAHVYALHTHDRRTRGTRKGPRLPVLIGKELGLRPEQLDKLQWAALLHDVGKLDVPSSILNKDGRPSGGGMGHTGGPPRYGERLIAPLAEWLGDWAGAITEHHERWDGEGYPRGLRAENISLAGRIVAVADSFEVMTAARSYKKPLSIAAARTELTRCPARSSIPMIVRASPNVSIGRVRRVLSPLAWAGQLPFIPTAAAIPAPGAIAATSALVGGLLLGPPSCPSSVTAARRRRRQQRRRANSTDHHERRNHRRSRGHETVRKLGPATPPGYVPAPTSPTPAANLDGT